MFLLFTNLVAAAMFIFGAIVSPDLGVGLLALGFLGVLSRIRLPDQRACPLPYCPAG